MQWLDQRRVPSPAQPFAPLTMWVPSREPALLLQLLSLVQVHAFPEPFI